MSTDAVVIPWRELSADALDAVIEEFVSREGTDYGHSDYALAEKVAAVKAQLARGQAQITWDPQTRTTHIQAK